MEAAVKGLECQGSARVKHTNEINDVVRSDLRRLEFVLLALTGQKVDYKANCQGDKEKHKKDYSLEILNFAILRFAKVLILSIVVVAQNRIFATWREKVVIGRFGGRTEQRIITVAFFFAPVLKSFRHV